MQFIDNATFSIHSLSDKGYMFSVEFLDLKQVKLFSRTFTFIHAESATRKEHVIWDVFTKNGISNYTEKLFVACDIKDLRNSQKFLSDPNQSTLMVLDLKDEEKGYISSTISNSEMEVCNFLTEKISKNCLSRSARKVHRLLKGKLNFIIIEGTLKADLLKFGGFTDSEISYLNSENGAIAFCQLAEYFMNGFKFGHSANVNGKIFSPENYIKPLSDRTFQPFSVSTVLYPSLYKHIYSPNGKFAETLSPVFSITGEFCEKTKITKLTYEMK